MLTIRSLEHDDITEVLRLNAEAVPAVFRLDHSEICRLMGISKLHLAATRLDGTLAGYALAFSKEESYDGEEFLALQLSISESFIYIDQITIEEQSRGTGIGRMLYAELALRARKLGTFIMCCEVNTQPPNPSSLAFHQRMGFSIVGKMSTSDGRTVALLKREA